MSITNLPVDIIRLILPLIPDSIGYYSIVCSCKLFAKLGREIKESMKKKYAVISEVICSYGQLPSDFGDTVRARFSLGAGSFTVNASRLPNGVLHGPTTICVLFGADEIWTYQDGQIHGLHQDWLGDYKIYEEMYRDGVKDGLIYRWRDSTPPLMFLRGLYDKGELFFLEEWYDYQTLRMQGNYQDPPGTSVDTYYRRDGTVEWIQKESRHSWINEYYDNQGVLIESTKTFNVLEQLRRIVVRMFPVRSLYHHLRDLVGWMVLAQT